MIEPDIEVFESSLSSRVSIKVWGHMTREIEEQLIREEFQFLILHHGDWSDLSVLSKLKDKGIDRLMIRGHPVDWDSVAHLRSLRMLEVKSGYGVQLSLGHFPKLKYLEAYWSPETEETLSGDSSLELLLLHEYPGEDLMTLPEQKSVQRFLLARARKLTSLNGIERLPQMSFFEIQYSPNLSDIKAIRGSSSLQSLILDTCKRVRKIPDGKGIMLKELLIDSDCIESLEPLRNWAALENLTFVSKVDDGNTAVLKEFENIKFAIFNNKRGMNAKRAEIAAHLESKGYDQEKYEDQRNMFSWFATNFQNSLPR